MELQDEDHLHEDQPLTDAIAYLHDAAIPKVLEESGSERDRLGLRHREGEGRPDPITQAYYSKVVPRIQPMSAEEKFSIDFDGVEVPVIGYIDSSPATRCSSTRPR